MRLVVKINCCKVPKYNGERLFKLEFRGNRTVAFRRDGVVYERRFRPTVLSVKPAKRYENNGPNGTRRYVPTGFKTVRGRVVVRGCTVFARFRIFSGTGLVVSLTCSSLPTTRRSVSKKNASPVGVNRLQIGLLLSDRLLRSRIFLFIAFLFRARPRISVTRP